MFLTNKSLCLSCVSRHSEDAMLMSWAFGVLVSSPSLSVPTPGALSVKLSGTIFSHHFQLPHSYLILSCPACRHHDVGAGEQPDLHGLASSVDHASSHSQKWRSEYPWSRHGQEEHSSGSQHHIGSRRSAATKGWQASVQLRQSHHFCYQQLAKEEDDVEWDLPVDLW